MATLLHRLGLFAARRVKTVIATWLALLAAAISAFLAFGGQLSDQITVPDLPTTEVADRLSNELPEAGGGSANVVLRTTDGTNFTEAQREQIASLADEVAVVSLVDAVSDPFATQAEMDAARAELAQAREELAQGRAELAAGREQIDHARAELDDAQAQLDAARAEAENAGYLPMVEADLDAQQSMLDEGRAELDAQAAELEQAEDELAAGEAELDRGEAMVELSADMRVISENGDVAVMAVSFSEPLERLGTDTLDEVGDILSGATIDGVDVLPTAALSMEIPQLFSVAEAIGLMVAAAVLLVMLGTLIGAGLPLLNALIGVGIGVTGALALSSVVEMMSLTPILGLMLGLAVGIDYSLFIIHRHRTQLRSGMPLVDSIALANGTAGNAVVFAGATVVIALAALNVTGLPFLGLMGTIGAVCVAIAVLIAVTLTPAMLKLLGERILRRSGRERAGVARQHNAGHASPVTTPMKTWRAVGVAVLSIAALGTLAIPTASLRMGLPDDSTQHEESPAYQAYTVVEEAFGPGVTGPLLVLADLPAGLDPASATDTQIAVATELVARDDVAAAVPVGMNDDASVAVFQLIPSEGPSSESVEELVHLLRADDLLAGADTAGVRLSVAGLTAANIDISDFIADVLPLYLIVVVGLSLLIMVMVFRSLLLPLIATLGFVLSFAAATGGVVAVFQWGWLGDLFGVARPGPIITFLPIVMVGIVFGLAMDYQLFTASGMREAYAHGAPARLAIRQGLYAGRTVVTAAALIMGSVFGGFVFTSDPMVASVGLGLALGVLLDAFVVRLLLVPALLHLAGPAAWWLPRWLDRILPDIDVEGAALERTSHATPRQMAKV